MKYCLGFMFNEKQTDVLLIEKKRPIWQMGKLNGLGGKVESGESSLEAMIREFKEECCIENTEWTYKLTMYGEDWSVDVFTANTDDVFDYKSLEDEEVLLIPINELDKFDCIPNVHWLIPLCLDSKIDYSINNSKK